MASSLVLHTLAMTYHHPNAVTTKILRVCSEFEFVLSGEHIHANLVNKGYL